jgi:hypothetical protein
MQLSENLNILKMCSAPTTKQYIVYMEELTTKPYVRSIVWMDQLK